METVLVIGSGGREVALVNWFLRSASVERVIAAPGSAAMKEVIDCFDIAMDDHAALIDLAKQEGVTLTVVGPEAALATGIVDAFLAEDLTIFGPTKAATRIESSKSYANQLMDRVGVPTAKSKCLYSYDALADVVCNAPRPIVLKEDGLKAGKGVRILRTEQDAKAALEALKPSKSTPIVYEEFLEGYECSLIVLANGTNFVALPVAQDHKSRDEGGKGPNTGGMGAVSPVPRISAEEIQTIKNEIITPTLKAMQDSAVPFTGFLYAGLMMTKEGPKVIEFNARMGDPESEVILPLIKNDGAALIKDILQGETPEVELEDGLCLGVTLASPGYPEAVTTQPLIPQAFIDRVQADPDMQLTAMGMEKTPEGWKAKGGRVLFVSTMADSIGEARAKIYSLLDDFELPLYYRSDIGNYAEVKETSKK